VSNNFDQDQVQSFIDAIEEQDKRMESEKGSYMRFCKSAREEQDTIYNSAKENGIPKKVLKGLVKERQLERQKKKVRDQIDEDYTPLYDDLRKVFANYQEPVQEDMDLEEREPEDA
jgi:uncharacterized protein (UPF0335 family)